MRKRKVERVVKRTAKKVVVQAVVPVPKSRVILKAIGSVIGEGLLMLSIAVFIAAIMYVYIMQL